jgi:hypothetical protein
MISSVISNEAGLEGEPWRGIRARVHRTLAQEGDLPPVEPEEFQRLSLALLWIRRDTQSIRTLSMRNNEDAARTLETARRISREERNLSGRRTGMILNQRLSLRLAIAQIEGKSILQERNVPRHGNQIHA